MDIRWTEDIWASPIRKPKPLIPGLVNQGELVMLSGLWDSYKSTLAMEMATAVASGRNFLGAWPVARQCPALIIQKEIHPGFFDERVMMATEGLGSIPLAVSYGGTGGGFNFDPGYKAVLQQVIEEHGFGLIVFDPLTNFWPTEQWFDENKADKVAMVLRPLLNLRRTGCTFMLVHHDTKEQLGMSNQARGSSVLLNDPDVRIRIMRSAGGGASVVFRNRNQKQPPTLHVVWEGGRLMSRAKVEEDIQDMYYGEGKSMRDIAKEVGVSPATIHRRVHKQVDNAV